jgi:putative Mg2+ transporter-C (MgtC) family protein
MHVPVLSPGEALLRLGVALVLGTVVGLERERGERAAGMRTHALVCLGSALITLVSAYGFTDFLSSPGVRIDPSRVAAQIVSGIGFLGAGTIILRREVVRGLTTAAGLWVVAGIGMAVGAGLYLASVAATVGALLILAILAPVERRLFPRSQTLTLRVRPQLGQIADMRRIMEGVGVRLQSLTLQSGATGEDLVRIRCTPPRGDAMNRLLEGLRTVPGIVSVEAAGASFGWTESDEDEENTAQPE